MNDESDGRAFVFQALTGRREMWAVRHAATGPGMGELAYPMHLRGLTSGRA